ncbi:MAG: TIM barrel protein [Bacteroidetes bacterium]|nr:TIM barrel protein [Bacteroidota bacterium]
MSLIDLRSQSTLLNGDALASHLNSFELTPKFSAGIWFFSPANSRFHANYKPYESIESRLEIAASLKDYGLEALEAHYPNEINEDNLDIWQKFIQDTGIKILTVIPLLFYDEAFEFGSLSNPDNKIRQSAIDRTTRSLQLGQELGCEFSVVWPGIDGYENPFGINMAMMRKRFAEGLAEALDNAPGTRIAFEPKPYEPRGRILYSLTPEGVLLGQQVEAMLQHETNTQLLNDDHKLVCMNPEIGHLLMGFEDIAYALSWPLSEGRLAHTHWNSQPLGNYDQDLNVGLISPEQMEAGLYVLKMHGYQGWFGLDINPERMPVDIALKISMDALRAACDRINGLDHQLIVEAVENPASHRGFLEAYMIRSRALNTTYLPPIEDTLKSIRDMST